MSDAGHVFSYGSKYGASRAPLPLEAPPTSEQEQELWGDQMTLSAKIQPHVESYPDSEQDWQSGHGQVEETGSVMSGNPTDWGKGKFPMRSTRESSVAGSVYGRSGPSRRRNPKGPQKSNLRFSTNLPHTGGRVTIGSAREVLERFQEMEAMVIGGQRFGVEIAEEVRDLKEKMAEELSKLEGRMEVDSPVADEALQE